MAYFSSSLTKGGIEASSNLVPFGIYTSMTSVHARAKEYCILLFRITDSRDVTANETF